MKVAIATKCVFILGLLLATTYWINSQCVISHNQWACNFQLFFITRNVNKNVTSNQLMGVFVNISKHYVCIDNNLFLAPPYKTHLFISGKGKGQGAKILYQKTSIIICFTFVEWPTLEALKSR